jgi:hypothetical protein
LPSVDLRRCARPRAIGVRHFHQKRAARRSRPSCTTLRCALDAQRGFPHLRLTGMARSRMVALACALATNPAALYRPARRSSRYDRTSAMQFSSCSASSAHGRGMNAPDRPRTPSPSCAARSHAHPDRARPAHRNLALLDQADSLKLELPRKLPSLQGAIPKILGKGDSFLFVRQ